MGVSPEQVANRLRAAEHARLEAGRARAHVLRAKVGTATTLLRAHGARRIWLFGSLAGGTPTRESDVDLAVLGMSPASYFDVVAQLMALFETRVDLVLMERAPESLAARIAETGSELL